VLEQLRLIDRVRELCRGDERLAAVLTYGSFPQGVADQWSDVEFWLFTEAGAELDPAAWCAAVGTLNLLVRNEFGAHVGFFPGLLRGEFHFAPAADIDSVRDWPTRGAPVAKMVLLDRTGALTAALASLPEWPPTPGAPGKPGAAEEVQTLCGRYANWLVLAHHVAQRGELLRAVDALAHVNRHLLWLARLVGGHHEHWLTPSRAAETDLPAYLVEHAYDATARADPDDIARALRAAWASGRVYWLELSARYGFPWPEALTAELEAALGR